MYLDGLSEAEVFGGLRVGLHGAYSMRLSKIALLRLQPCARPDQEKISIASG
jgi:hypothetical protein